MGIMTSRRMESPLPLSNYNTVNARMFEFDATQGHGMRTVGVIGVTGPFWTFLVFFAIQFINYALLSWNWRAIATVRYWHNRLSNVFCVAVTYFLIKEIASATGWVALAGLICGGVVGSEVALRITRKWQ
jgi:hypothetical protein